MLTKGTAAVTVRVQQHELLVSGVQELVRLLQEELEVTNTDKFLKVKDEKKNTVVITRFEGLTLLIHEAQELLKNIADDN
jgi:hypothetical protein